MMSTRCEVEVERQFLAAHEERECKFRQYKCEYCGYTVTYDAIAGSGEVIGRESEIEPSKNHYSRCGNFPKSY